MKQVDFYIIAHQVVDAKYKLASRLCNKLATLQLKTLIVTDDEASSNQLDKIMWSFSDTSFVAHECLDNKKQFSDHSFINIAENNQVDNKLLTHDYQILLNLTEQTLLFHHHFERIAEVIEAGETAKIAGRNRYKNYQQEGFELKTHTVEL